MFEVHDKDNPDGLFRLVGHVWVHTFSCTYLMAAQIEKHYDYLTYILDLYFKKNKFWYNLKYWWHVYVH